MQRVELAWHTGYSRMNGIGLGEDIANFVAIHNIKKLAITDIGNVDGYVDIQKNLKSKCPDTKLIMGADLYVFDDRDYAGKAVTSGRLSLLIRDEKGKKNLYKILSEGERKYKNGTGEPQIPLSFILNNREGLLIGSGSESGLLMSIYDEYVGKDNLVNKDIIAGFDRDIYKFLDYIEIPCDGINNTIVDELLKLAGYYKIPPVASCVPHCMEYSDSKAYAVLTNKPYESKHYRNTEDMLEAFDFLGKEKAYEIVVTNTNLIADMCELVPAVPESKTYPVIENQDEFLRKICENALPKKYKEITSQIRKRLEWELNAIKSSETAFIFLQIKDVIERLGLMPFEFSSRGAVSSSIVSYLCEITEVDPIKAKLCPYFLFGLMGEKEPNIVLNFGEHIKDDVQKAFSEAPGVGTVIKAGTLGTVGEMYAERLIDGYSEKYKKYFGSSGRVEILDSLRKTVMTRGQHLGGLIMLERDVDVNDIFPITTVYGGNEVVETSAFEYYSIDNITYKFDALGHNSPTILKKLYDLTGENPGNISLEDPEVLEMFKIRDGKIPKCAGIPEFGSEYVLNAMKTADCQSFEDLVKLCSLMHGTNVWTDNAEVLIKEGTAGISEVLADRNDIYDYLVEHDIDEETAFKITENVRKGKVSRGKVKEWTDWKDIMREHLVPEWFIYSCEKIEYMFPRAHSYSYMMNSWRIAWFKLHYPLEFYAVMMNVSHNIGFDPKYMAVGKDKMDDFMCFLNSKYVSDGFFVRKAKQICILLHDYYDHGFEFKVSDAAFEDDEMFRIVDDHTIEVDVRKCD